MDWYELLLTIGTWGLLGTMFLFVTSQLFGGRPVFSMAFGVFVAGFLARIVVIMLNEEFAFFDAKLAGNRSLDLFKYYVLDGHGWTGLLREEFAAQVLLNIPVWLLCGPSRESLLFSNAVVGALAGSLAAVLLYRDFGISSARRSMLMLAIYPAGFNFSVFGLRDPIIFLSMMTMVIGGMRIWGGGMRIQNLLLVGSSACFTLWLRPELAYVVLAFLAIPVMNIYMNVVLNSMRSKNALGSLLLMTVPVILLGVGAIAMATGVAAKNIEARTINPADIADKSAEDRYERHDAALGGGSHMVSAAVYTRLPWYLRVPVQTAGLIILPFPWQVNNVSKLLAFGDSLFIIGLTLFVLVNARYSEPVRTAGAGRLSLFLLLISLIGFVGLGFVVSNFGNGFRMRLSVTPMVFLAAAVVPIRVRFHLFSRARRQSAVVQSC